jgi:hypothetical protein
VQAPVEDRRGPVAARTHLGAKYVSESNVHARKVTITIKNESFVASIVTDQVHPTGLLSRNILVPIVVYVFQCLDGGHLDWCIAASLNPLCHSNPSPSPYFADGCFVKVGSFCGVQSQVPVERYLSKPQ